MTAKGRRSMVGRTLAGAILASFVLSFAPPPVSAATDPMDCAGHHAFGSGSTIAPTAPGACDPSSMDWCGLMPGCTAPPPALAAVSAVAPVVAILAGVPPRAGGTLHGQLALGPPTPPPNS